MRDIKDVTAIYQNHQKAIVQANALNKESVFDALGRAGIGLVLVDFDGESDEGQVENLQAYMDDKPVPLPTETIPFNTVSWNAHKLDASTMPIAEAIESLCYDYLEQEHGGWENNDGAYVEDVTLAGGDVAVFSISAIRMGREPAFSLTAGTLHHGAILDHSIDRKSLCRDITGWFFMRASTHVRGAALRAAGTGCNLTPGLSPFRNSIPAFSSVESTWESVEVREPISSWNDSIRRMVPIATRERFASSVCSQPISARAARSCLPVINPLNVAREDY